jgi:predicted short-subunit dehydrogenase-like oxidoreductase (DUF2520 family)
MNIALYGPGRAGGSLVIAASRVGHTITSIDGRDDQAVSELTRLVELGDAEPDLLVLAVSDDAIPTISAHIDFDALPPSVVHMSGAVPVSALAPFQDAGSAIGSFHPLQTMPSPLAGADRLRGASVAVTATEDLARSLEDLARSLGCVPFRISDQYKPLYHAGAAAAANFTMTALGIAHDLFEAAGVDPASSRPLVEAIVANAFEIGPRSALTGPIARGDVATVAAQVDAVKSDAPEAVDAFVAMAKATAVYSGRSEEFAEVLG